jgi:hypothetical protein
MHLLFDALKECFGVNRFRIAQRSRLNTLTEICKDGLNGRDDSRMPVAFNKALRSRQI